MSLKLSKDKFLSKMQSQNSPAINNNLQNSTVGIAGCGGLGSNVAVALTRAGIFKLVLIDFDKVEISNLNRQQFTIRDISKYKVDVLTSYLKSINPYIKIESRRTKLNNKNIFSVFKECRIIVEAFDTIEAKAMIIKSFADDRFKDKFLVAASGTAGMGSSNTIKTKKLADNIYVCGDNKSEPGAGLMAPRVMITAGHQANAVIRIISNLS